MPKKPYRFFKPVASDRHRIHPKAAATVALLVTLSFALGYVSVIKSSPMATLKADPAVWESIINDESAFVTIVYEGNLSHGGLMVYKHWKFGDLNIVYAKALPDTLKELVQDKKVIRISAWKKVGLPPYKFVVKSEGVTYDFTKDYKRIYHKANDRWTGKGVTVAIIDTGIDYLHPDFYRNGKTVIKALVSTVYESGNAPLVYDTEGFTEEQMKQVFEYEKFVMNSTNSNIFPFEDAIGHGTHVAGIIAGQGIASDERYKGIAPGVDLVVIKAFYDDKGYATEETILDALQWVYDNAEKYDIKILSCSWGSPPNSPLPDSIELAMEKLVKDKGIVVFAAAGNEGAIPTTILSPARDPLVFAVGAIDPYANKLAPFSSLGEPIIPPFNLPDKTKPDFVGAGVNVIAPASRFAQFPDYALIHGNGGDYVIMSGTSMATPSDAATFAAFYQMYLEKYGRPPTKQDFVNYVREKGHVYDPIAKDFITGWGAPVVPAPK